MCLLSECAVQGDAKRAQRKRKRVYAEVCLWDGASDQSYWVRPSCPAVPDLIGRLGIPDMVALQRGVHK